STDRDRWACSGAETPLVRPSYNPQNPNIRNPVMRSLRLVALLTIAAHSAFAQQPAARGSALSLEDALATARRNNPLYLQTENGVRIQDANVCAAFGQLLPRASAGFDTRYQQGGTQYYQGVAIGGGSTDAYNSSYSVGLSYNVSAAIRYAPRAAKANRTAAEADVKSGAEVLRAGVTQAYITPPPSEPPAPALDSLVQTAAGQLELVNAKLKVGAGTIIDVRSAEVALGQAQVNSLTAHNTAEIDKLRLYQVMGVPAELGTKLTTTFQ